MFCPISLSLKSKLSIKKLVFNYSWYFHQDYQLLAYNSFLIIFYSSVSTTFSCIVAVNYLTLLFLFSCTSGWQAIVTKPLTRWLTLPVMRGECFTKALTASQLAVYALLYLTCAVHTHVCSFLLLMTLCSIFQIQPLMLEKRKWHYQSRTEIDDTWVVHY